MGQPGMNKDQFKVSHKYRKHSSLMVIAVDHKGRGLGLKKKTRLTYVHISGCAYQG